MLGTGETRGHWGTRFGFIMAAAGSAVGLGNIWRFPYIAGENGGAVFIVVYIALVFTLGISMMLAELAIGRMSQRNPVGAFARLKGGKWVIVGYFGVVAAFLILPFYSVVGGWTLAYTAKMASGAIFTTDATALSTAFGTFISQPAQPVLWHALFMGFTIAVVVGGVGSGIERVVRVLMPLLLLILIILAVRSVTLPGAGEGLTFYLRPDFSQIGPEMLHVALGQVFFSLSLGMGAMITYGSYLSVRGKLARNGGWVTLLDTCIALVAGLAILPAVFAFGLSPAEGPGLSFVTLPAVFAHMPAGIVFGVLFFALLVIAALTSAISLLEVVTAYLVDERGLRRRIAAASAGIVMFLIGVPASLAFGLLGEFTLFGKNFFDLLEYVSVNILLPLGAIFIALFLAWVIWPRAAAEVTPEGGVLPRWATAWRWTSGIVAPAVIAWILITGL